MLNHVALSLPRSDLFLVLDPCPVFHLAIVGTPLADWVHPDGLGVLGVETGTGQAKT